MVNNNNTKILFSLIQLSVEFPFPLPNSRLFMISPSISTHSWIAFLLSEWLSLSPNKIIEDRKCNANKESVLVDSRCVAGPGT